MNDNKFQPAEDMFDADTEGHMPRLPNRLGSGQGEETAGHMPPVRRSLLPGDDAPTQGHMPKVRNGAAPQDDETEGHGVRIRF
jgi:hypothetical protein